MGLPTLFIPIIEPPIDPADNWVPLLGCPFGALDNKSNIMHSRAMACVGSLYLR